MNLQYAFTWLSGLIALVAVACGLYFSVVQYEYLVVFILGVLFSAIELGSRYKDEPFRVFVSVPGLVYLLVNGFICIFGLYLIRVFELSVDVSVSDSNKELAQTTADVLQASLSTFFIMRSSFLQLGKGSSQVDLGLNQLLKKLIDILDRQVDRARAKARSKDVTTLLKKVTYEDVLKQLLPFCLVTMQNVSSEESEAVFQEVEDIDTSDELNKKLSVGLLIYSVVGRDVFESAIGDLGLEKSEEVGVEAEEDENESAFATIVSKAGRAKPE